MSLPHQIKFLCWCVRGNEEGQTKLTEQGISPWRVGNMTAVNCLSIVQSKRHHPSPHLRSLLDSSGCGGWRVWRRCAWCYTSARSCYCWPSREKRARGEKGNQKEIRRQAPCTAPCTHCRSLCYSCPFAFAFHCFHVNEAKRQKARSPKWAGSDGERET